MYTSARKYFIQFAIVAFVLGFIPTLYFIHAASQLETQAVSSVEKQTRLQLEFSQHDLLRMLESTHQATQLLAKNDLYSRLSPHQAKKHSVNSKHCGM